VSYNGLWHLMNIRPEQLSLHYSGCVGVHDNGGLELELKPMTITYQTISQTKFVHSSSLMFRYISVQVLDSVKSRDQPLALSSFLAQVLESYAKDKKFKFLCMHFRNTGGVLQLLALQQLI